MTIRFYGQLGRYGFLSNFYPCELNIGGLPYLSVEHAFQAFKTLDPKVHEKIRLARTPGEAKYLGRKCKLRPDWDKAAGTPALAAKFKDNQGCVVELVKDHFMYTALIMKFTMPDLADKLLSTGTHELIEASVSDYYWGQGNGSGKNKLGRMLQLIRAGIQTTLVS